MCYLDMVYDGSRSLLAEDRVISRGNMERINFRKLEYVAGGLRSTARLAGESRTAVEMFAVYFSRLPTRS